MRDSFVFYRSFYEAIRELPRDVQGEVYAAIMEYALNGECRTEHLKPIARSIFTLIKPQLNANIARFEAGRKGGAPVGNKNACKVDTQKQPTTKKQPRNNQKQPNENVNVNVNVNENGESVRTRAREDFSNLPESLRTSLETYWAVRAESGYPVYAVQQSFQVAKLLSATGGDFAKAEKWAKNATAKNLRDIEEPFASIKDQSAKPEKGKSKIIQPDEKVGTWSWQKTKETNHDETAIKF
jgi:hypothetical protein